MARSLNFYQANKDCLHISEIMWKRLENMENVFQEGDKVKVKLVGVDPKTGKFKLSRKALLPKPEQSAAPQQHHNNDH